MGGKSGGTQNVTQEFKPPSWTTGNAGWQTYMDTAAPLVDYLMQPHNQGSYEGGRPWDDNGGWIGSQQDWNMATSRVAPFNPIQRASMLQGTGNMQDPLYNGDINNYMRGVLNGNGSNWSVIQNWVNPYASAGNEYANIQNPYMNLGNAYGGATNPAFEQMLASQRRNAEDTYNRTTGANMDALESQSSAFGNTALTEQRAANEGALQDALNRSESAARSEQYGRAAGLEQQRLNTLFGGAESGLNRATQAEEARLGRGFQGTEDYFGRGMQDYNTMLGAEMQTLGQMPQIAGMQTGLVNQGLGIGNQLQQNQQEMLNALQQGYGQNLQQALLPYDVWGAMLSRASGQGGSQLTTSTASANPWQYLMGGGLLGAGAYGAYNNW